MKQCDNTKNQKPNRRGHAAALANLLGQTKTETLTRAWRGRLVKFRRRRVGGNLGAELDEVARHCASLPIVDNREPDDIVGYDERGLPT